MRHAVHTMVVAVLAEQDAKSINAVTRNKGVKRFIPFFVMTH
jgi:hypothetical protein